MSPLGRRQAGPTTALAGAWAGALALLAFEWTQSPLTGSGHAFLIWSIAAVPLSAFTWSWLRRLPTVRIPLGFTALSLITVTWVAVGFVAATAPGDEWLLDGLILRRPLQRVGGVALWWAPGVWGLTLSLMGLAAALEARYQVTNDKGSNGVLDRTPLLPSSETSQAHPPDDEIE